MRGVWTGLFTLCIVVPLLMSAFLYKRLPMTDEGVMLVHTQEIMEGSGPYGPTECPYTPLAFFLQAAWMKAAGSDLVTGRVPVVLLATLTALSVFGATLRFAPPSVAAVTGFAVVAATFPYQCYASYNNYALFFVTASASVLVMTGDAQARLMPFLAGALAAAAFFCKQNLGGLSAIAGGVAIVVAAPDLRAGIRQLVVYSLGGIVATALFLGFAAVRGFLHPMLEQALLGGLRQSEHFAGWYPMNQAALMAGFLKSPSLYLLDNLAHSLSFVMPFFVALILAIVSWVARRRGDAIARSAAILAAMSPLLHLGAIHAPTTWHIIFTKPVPIMALSCLLVWLGMRPRMFGVAIAIGLIVSGIHIGRLVLIFDDYTAEIRAPLAENIRTRDWEAEIINTALDVLRTAPPDAPVFVAAPDPMYYYLAERKPPLKWIYLDPPWVSSEQGGEIVADLRRTRSRVLLIRGRNKWYDYLQIPALAESIAGRKVEKTAILGAITIELFAPETAEDASDTR
jgi:hypothetical protein